MDVIGALAAFAPNDLSRLEYVGGNASSSKTVTIPASKFIIVFPARSIIQVQNDAKSTVALAPNTPLVVTPGSAATMIHTNYETTVFLLNLDGTTVTINGNTYYAFAYCPV